MIEKKIILGCFGNNYSILLFFLITNINLRKKAIIILENLDLILPYKTILLKRRYKYFLEIVVLIMIFILKILKINILVYGQDHLLSGNKLLLSDNFYLIEDGSMNYSINILEKRKGLKRIVDIFLQRKEILGIDKGVKKIYLTGLAPIPEEIIDKVEIINLKELWNKKSDFEKEEILDIFGFKRSTIENLKGKEEILYTQPLSEDGVISEKDKIELYKKIIKNYDEKKLVIKKHPREKTNYKDIFSKIEVLDQNFPAELFNLLEINFKKAITIFSTAVLSNKDIKIDFYGTEIHPKLLKKFGSMEKIIKRNAFLD